jgi:hypothetical protein
MYPSPVNNKIEIYFSRKKLVLLLAGMVAFCAIGCWLIIQPKETISFHLIPIPAKALGITALIFFGTIGIFMARKMADNKPALTIDDLGMEDRSGILSGGYILWQDIITVSAKEIKGQKFIMIGLRDPDKYFGQKNRLSGLFLKFNRKTFKGDISISTNGLDISFDDLYTLIKDRSVNKPMQPR